MSLWCWKSRTIAERGRSSRESTAAAAVKRERERDGGVKFGIDKEEKLGKKEERDCAAESLSRDEEEKFNPPG